MAGVTETEPATGASPVADAILTAADDCFARFGVAKTTMDDVARAAGVSRATVYRYFQDRESLLLASVRRHADVNIERVRSELSNGATLTERLVEGIARDVRRGRRDPVMKELVSNTELAVATRLLGRGGIGVELTRKLWEPVLLAAQEAGELRAGIDVIEVCDWISQLEIMFISQFDESDGADERMRAAIVQFVAPALVAS